MPQERSDIGEVTAFFFQCQRDWRVEYTILVTIEAFSPNLFQQKKKNY